MKTPSAKLRVVDADLEAEVEAEAEARESSAEDAARSRDAALVQRARRGDKRAWVRLYQDNFDRTFRYLVYLVGDADLAEDFTQETFARALVSLKKFRGDASVRTWLNCIAVNVAREHWRRTQRGRKIRENLTRIVESAPPEDELHKSFVDSVRSKVLYAVLDELPVNLREAFVLRDLLGLDGRTAAKELGISAGNVAVRAHRARGRIRDRLEELGWLNEVSVLTGDEGEPDAPEDVRDTKRVASGGYASPRGSRPHDTSSRCGTEGERDD